MKKTDFIEIKNYYKKAGQGGKLGIAFNKKGKKYLLKKGEYGEPANEYVYSLVAKNVGVSCQTCHLVAGFGFPVVAFDYITPMPSNQQKNFDMNLITDDFVKAMVLDVLTRQDDGLQYVISSNGKFYKIDNSEAFIFDKVDEYVLTSQSDQFIADYYKKREDECEYIVGSIERLKKTIIDKFGAEQIDNFNFVLQQFLFTDFNFLSNDKELKAVYSAETYKYFLFKINVIKKAIKYVLDNQKG